MGVYRHEWCSLSAADYICTAVPVSFVGYESCYQAIDADIWLAEMGSVARRRSDGARRGNTNLSLDDLYFCLEKYLREGLNTNSHLLIRHFS